MTIGNWRFIGFFAGVYATLELLYFAVPDAFLRDFLHSAAIAQPCVWLITQIAPGEGVAAVHGSLRSATATLQIVRGCDGAGVTFLMMAAVAASRPPWMQAAVGLAVAIVLTYALNLVRVALLYFVVSSHPDLFGVMHDYALPAAIVLACGLAFSKWASWSLHPQARAHSGAAASTP
jgi:exosortase family protein XrtM